MTSNPLPLLLVSPHPDDAAFALGGALAVRRSKRPLHVLNVFSIQGYSVLDESYEQTQVRLDLEESRVATCLKYTSHAGDLRAANLRGYSRLSDIVAGTRAPKIHVEDTVASKVEQVIRSTCEQLKPSWLLLPLAADNVDHLIVMRAGLQVARTSRVPFTFYEDLPYAVNAHARTRALHYLKQCGFNLRERVITGDFIAKEAVLKLYESQMRDRMLTPTLHYGRTSLSRPGERLWFVGSSHSS